MHIAILTFEGFNELDSLIAYAILNRIRRPDWRVSIASPAARVTSMNGLVIDSQIDLQQACAADAVIVGSGMRTRGVVADEALMAQLRLDPARQLLAAQCSGTLLLARLGLLHGVAACTDLTSKPWVEAAGVAVLDQPLFARGNVATAGGCLASTYLAAWVIARLVGLDEARQALHYVAPVGEKVQYLARAMAAIGPYLQDRTEA
ncbi:DJ-1/PfpI family protein [Ectopseudomonas toyotomiensis]|uniref:DJ-1/PfpI family protein n=1 Tax=Ectopseudomonas toyotomiensis TaxID=554344 RepID=A0AA42INB0_9GAMM|nr:DJ-1/PfpI family protein [Pseudomonas toyotomiensis]MBG0838720.1 DJ-1/PfpI family protein [Pseudomonas toyotomiensis]MDH0700206.1 DJ-1/PfpI family protein [Pseudomonas toyotomiensis]